MKVAFLSGTSIAKSEVFSDWESKEIETMYGLVRYKMRGEKLVLNRHGPGTPLPPHTINHRANIRALSDLGYENVIALSSVGSLRTDLLPGTFVSCADYVNLHSAPATFFDAELKGGAPGIENNLVPWLVEELKSRFTVQTGKVYVQMVGPRFETKAEIRIIKNWGDVVGMTAASEADLCREIGLRYNSFAIVDNFANGLTGDGIDFLKFAAAVKSNQKNVDEFLTRLLEILG